jgi:hypothetical protein
MRAGKLIPLWDLFRFDETSWDQPTIFNIEFIADNAVRYRYEIAVDGMEVLKECLSCIKEGKETSLIERMLPLNNESLSHGGRIENRDIITVFKNLLLLSKFGKDTPNEIITPAYLYLANLQVVFAEETFTNRMGEIVAKVDGSKAYAFALNEILSAADTGLVGLASSKLFPDLGVPGNVLEELKKYMENYPQQLFGFHNVIGEKKTRSLPFIEESNGTQHLCMIAGIILQALKQGRTIFIDEIDMSLHTHVIKMLIQLFQSKELNKKHAQLIMTTHNTNLLDYTLFRKDQIWFAEKNEEGSSELFSLQDFADVAEDTPFDKWYLAGKFGATPNIKDMPSLVGALIHYLRDEEATAD